MTQSEDGRNQSNDGIFRVEISNESFSFRTFEFSDPKITGQQIVMEFGKHPAEHYVALQWLKSGEIETLRPTELVDLKTSGTERFFVVEGDKTYRFTVDGLSMEWPLSSLLGRHIKALVGAADDMDLVQDRDSGDEVIADDASVALSEGGVERLKLRKRPQVVTVFYNHNPVLLTPRGYSTEELLVEFRVPAGYLLDEVASDGKFRELKPGETIVIREGLQFISHAPRGQSS